MADGVVLVVLNRQTGVAVLACEAADVARDHHAVTCSDTGAAGLGALDGSVRCLRDEHRNRRCRGSAHVDLVHDIDVLGNRIGICVLGFDQVLPGQTGILRQHIADGRVFESSHDVTSTVAEILPEIDVVRTRNADDCHADHAAPPDASARVAKVVGRIDQHASLRGTDQVVVDLRCICGSEYRSPVGGDRSAGVTHQRDLCVVGDSGFRDIAGGTQSVERHHPVFGSGSEVCIRALGVRDDDGVAQCEERPEQGCLDGREGTADVEVASAGRPVTDRGVARDRARRTVVGVQGIVKGLVRNNFVRLSVGGAQDRGDVGGRLSQGVG